MLEFSASTPLYIQIKDKLLSEIQSGALQPGQKIPTEFELSASYGVSRITVRNAVLELVKSGHLLRCQGKGTYVYKPADEQNLHPNQSFFFECAARGIKPGSKIAVAQVRQCCEDDVKELNSSAGGKVLYIERILYADGSPVILEYVFLPEKFISIISELSDNTSLCSLLENRFKTGRLSSVKRFGIAQTDDYQSGLLGVENPTPVLSLREVAYDAAGTPVFRRRQLILSDRFEYIVKH